MPHVVRHWSREEVLALPDDGMRHELFDGELVVTPAPRSRHQFVVGDLFVTIAEYVRAHRLGKASLAPADLPLRGGQVAQPDLFVLPHTRFAQDWSDAPVPFLVVEVSSPATVRYDRGLKRQAYQRAGVAEYWIVDVESEVVERWRPDDVRPEVLRHTLTWQPSSAAAALVIDLGALFADNVSPPATPPS